MTSLNDLVNENDGVILIKGADIKKIIKLETRYGRPNEINIQILKRMLIRNRNHCFMVAYRRKEHFRAYMILQRQTIFSGLLSNYAFSDKFIININAKLKIDFGADLVEKCMCHATDNWGLSGIFTILHRIHQDHLVRIFVNHYYFKEVSNDEMLVEPAYVLLICDKHLYSKRLLRS